FAPLGVFALAFGLGSAAGGLAFATLDNYILLVCAVGLVVTLAAYPLAVAGGRIPLGAFTRAMLPPEGIAISTRSSLACLPAMLTSARQLGVRESVSDVSLPIAVALFRGTGPAMNIAVAVYVAHALGLDPGIGAILAATAVGAVMSYAAIGLPGEISYISSIAPIAIALGAPIAPLALLVAVEMIPDIIRTLGNVCADVAVTAVVDRTGMVNAGGPPFVDSATSERPLSGGRQSSLGCRAVHDMVAPGAHIEAATRTRPPLDQTAGVAKKETRDA